MEGEKMERANLDASFCLFISWKKQSFGGSSLLGLRRYSKTRAITKGASHVRRHIPPSRAASKCARHSKLSAHRDMLLTFYL